MPDHPPSNPWRSFAARLRGLTNRERLLAAVRKNPVGTAISTAAVIFLLVFAAITIYHEVRRPPDVHNESVTFNPNESKVREKTVNWPRYGYDRRRTRYLAAKGIKPPFKKLWKYGGRPLLEFAPIYAEGKVFGLDNSGHAFAIDAKKGKVLWKRRVATLNASAPTFSHHRLYVANLTPGHILSLDPKNGHTVWKKILPGRSESSPVVVDKRVFFGDESGTMFAVDRRNGHTIWTTQLCGSIKAAPAYQHGILFVGDYGGCMSAVNSHNGKVKWQTSSQGLGLGVTGRFYSTPAVAFGRVYTGNLDNRVYSFDAQTGEIAWSHSTGGYVYSGPTVADTPSTPPSVYIGSVDGNVYALDAKTGETRWSHSLGGQILGSTSGVGNIVYAGTYVGTTTYGFSMRNGHQVFKFSTGGANSPVISDGHRIYLTGYSSITALQPLTKKQVRKRAEARKNHRRHAAAQKKHRRRAKAERKQKRAAARKRHRQRNQAGKKDQGGGKKKQQSNKNRSASN
jgi:outer membrane protein assembly factor BamB